MARVLVIRLSALGDVAISVPLIKALAEQYPEHEFIMVSQPMMAGLFESCPSNVIFKPASIRGIHKGLLGLYRLYREIGHRNVDVVCDMHDVVRSRILTFFFSLHRLPIFRIDKERQPRAQLTRRRHKVLRQLKTSFERYRDVFACAGMSLNYFDLRPKMEPLTEYMPAMESLHGPKNTIWLGFAPFAQHQGKIYPLEKMEVVLAHFALDERFTTFLFGGGTNEIQQMEKWIEQYPTLKRPNCKSLKEEVQLIGCLDLMFAMDSANMHLGSLAHTPVISIWGATHPYAGFYGLFQADRNRIQVDLPCRPCSIYGKKPCYRKDYACMNTIAPETIIARIHEEVGV